MQRSKSIALVTGASGGIGLQIAELLARDGYDLALVARSGDALEQIAQRLRAQYGISATAIKEDLSAPGAAQRVFAAVPACDVLVNNAGFATHGKFAELPLERELEELELNVVTLTALTGLYVRGMVRAGSGKILNVASTAGFLPGPLMAVYYASKAYVLSFSEAIANELRGTGVTVTALCPGATATGFAARANMGNTLLFRFGLGDAASVAKAGYEGMNKGKTIVVPGLKDKLMIGSLRLSHTGLVTRLSRAVVEGGN